MRDAAPGAAHVTAPILRQHLDQRLDFVLATPFFGDGKVQMVDMLVWTHLEAEVWIVRTLLPYVALS